MASYPNIDLYWDQNMNDSTTSRMVRKFSNKQYHFLCKKCKHQNYQPVSKFMANTGCEFCSTGGNGGLCDNINCKQCFSNSFESHLCRLHWNYEKNNSIPRMVRKKSEKKFWFICPYCNKDYIASPKNISNGHWCNCRKNKTEAKLYDWLQPLYPDTIKQYKIPNTNNYRYDFYIPSLKLIIELDGPQHFEQVSNWDDYKKTQYKDTYKSILAIRKGYSIIRVYQPNVWKNKIDWKFELSKVIQKNSKPKIHFISNGYQ